MFNVLSVFDFRNPNGRLLNPFTEQRLSMNQYSMAGLSSFGFVVLHRGVVKASLTHLKSLRLVSFFFALL